MDPEKAGSRCSNMWRKLGGLYEKAAYDAIERRLYDTGVKCARIADVCFWQATGENEYFQMKDVI